MAEQAEPVTIKKYANRRLYNTGTSTYVTLEDLAAMVKRGDDFVVFDAKTGDEITRSVLTQIIFEQESKGQNLLPITFLRQLIRFYGDSLQNLVPTYLDFSMNALAREQEKFRSQMTQAFGAGPFRGLDEHVRRNTEMFDQAMRMFLPFGPRSDRTPGERASGEQRTPAEPPPAPQNGQGELDALKRQLADMQQQINKLSDKE